MLIKTDNNSSKSVEKFKDLRTILRNQNYSERNEQQNACYHSVRNPLSSSLQSNNIKIKIHRNIILRVVLYGCETWSLILRDDSTLRMYENRVLRRIFGPRQDEETG